MLFMTRNSKLLFLFILLIAFAVNACKKDDTKTSITGFLTRQPWKLALKQRFAYVNNVLVKTDTLQRDCALTQTLTFKPDNTYTYENYACTPDTVNATWSLTYDNVYLNLNSIISVNSNKQENITQLITLGEYSLVFDTGDVYRGTRNITSTTDSVIVFRYGFIH